MCKGTVDNVTVCSVVGVKAVDMRREILIEAIVSDF